MLITTCKMMWFNEKQMSENENVITFPLTIVGGGGEVAKLLGPTGRTRLADNRVFDNPSAAACALKMTKGINGWRFWKSACGHPLYVIKNKHPDVFTTDKHHVPVAAWKSTTVNLDQPPQKHFEHGPCILKWQQLIQQCGRQVLTVKRAVHPYDTFKPAACFILGSPLVEKEDVFVASMILLSRSLSQTNPQWAFRTTVRYNGSEICCYASDDCDVVLGSGLNMEQTNNVIAQFNDKIVKRFELPTKFAHHSKHIVVRAQTQCFPPPDTILRLCIKFAAQYSSCLFTFSHNVICLHVYFSRH
jgi:hypothetical protein